MKYEVKGLQKAMELVAKSGSTNIEIYESRVNSITRLVVKFEDLMGNQIELQLAEAESGGFDYIERRERF